MRCKSLRWTYNPYNAYRLVDKRCFFNYRFTPVYFILSKEPRPFREMKTMDQQKQQSLSALFNTVASLERKLMNEWNHHNELGISKSHILLLQYLAAEGPKRPSAIAEHLQVTTGGVTVLTTKLIKAGFIERKQNELDRRAAFIHITDDGLKMLEISKLHIDTFFDKLFGMLSTEEIDTLRTIFNKCLLVDTTEKK